MTQPQQQVAARRRNVALLIALVVVLLLGGVLYAIARRSAADRIEWQYGRRSGSKGRTSVNGTAVLADMFAQWGHRVSSWRYLSPRLLRCNVIVWVPDDFRPPTPKQRQWLEKWLEEVDGRTLVYVGRDYDAEIDYWRQVLPEAPPDQAEEVLRRLAAAQARHDRDRLEMPATIDAGWFTLERDAPPVRATHLEGPWSRDIDPRKAHLVVQSRLQGPQSQSARLQVTALLEDVPGKRFTEEHRYLALQVTDAYRWNNSKIIVVANGCYLLNLPLVNQEHRKLAGRLIEACGPPTDVVFLESEAGGPPIRQSDDAYRRPTAFGMLSIWPISGIIVHVALLGILLCFALLPIFGRPRQPEPPALSDFARHVDAVGRLLQRTGDTDYARRCLAVYQQRVKGEP